MGGRNASLLETRTEALGCEGKESQCLWAEGEVRKTWEEKSSPGAAE